MEEPICVGSWTGRAKPEPSNPRKWSTTFTLDTFLRSTVQLHPHVVCGHLQELLPEATVAGGSFAENLPPPGDLSQEERKIAYNRGKSLAVRVLVKHLLRSQGLTTDLPLPRGERGERNWPNGYTGSTSNKGAVVLGAIAREKELLAVGIDVEREQGGHEELSHTLNAEDEKLPIEEESLSVLGGFSAKEAVYKAFYPLEEAVIGFQEIELEWVAGCGATFQGIAHCPSDITLDLRSRCSGKWIVSAAFETP